MPRNFFFKECYTIQKEMAGRLCEEGTPELFVLFSLFLFVNGMAYRLLEIIKDEQQQKRI